MLIFCHRLSSSCWAGGDRRWIQAAIRIESPAWLASRIDGIRRRANGEAGRAGCCAASAFGRWHPAPPGWLSTVERPSALTLSAGDEHRDLPLCPLLVLGVRRIGGDSPLPPDGAL